MDRWINKVDGRLAPALDSPENDIARGGRQHLRELRCCILTFLQGSDCLRAVSKLGAPTGCWHPPLGMPTSIATPTHPSAVLVIRRRVILRKLRDASSRLESPVVSESPHL